MEKQEMHALDIFSFGFHAWNIYQNLSIRFGVGCNRTQASGSLHENLRPCVTIPCPNLSLKLRQTLFSVKYELWQKKELYKMYKNNQATLISQRFRNIN
jgi:hypothetical protein